MAAKKQNKISDLIPDQKNFNKHNEFGTSLLEKSMRKYGAGRSILIDRNNNIIAGNGVTEMAGQIGIEDLQIVESDGKRVIAVKRTDIDLNTPEGREMALADNQVAAKNIILDAEMIEAELGEAVCEEWGIEMAAPAATEDDYVIPDEIKTDIVLGDLFEIGQHRLLCGDATNAEDVNKLLDGGKPNLMVTDPPYGVQYDPQWRHRAGINNSGRTGSVRNDDNCRWLAAYNLFPGNILYIWCASQRSALVHEDIVNAGFVPNYQIIWNKQQIVFGRGDYHWKHEPCWMATRKGKNHDWIGDRKQSTVWDIDNLLSKHDSDSKSSHGTQKPIECMARPIINHSGEVYDPFIGSGTTMVAAHQLNRKCYGIEIDPKYCQVIVDRMLKLDPSLIIKKNGQPYAQI